MVYQGLHTSAGLFNALVWLGSKVLITSEGRRSGPEPSLRKVTVQSIIHQVPMLKARRMLRTKGEGQRGRDLEIDLESCPLLSVPVLPQRPLPEVLHRHSPPPAPLRVHNKGWRRSESGEAPKRGRAEEVEHLPPVWPHQPSQRLSTLYSVLAPIFRQRRPSKIGEKY